MIEIPKLKRGEIYCIKNKINDKVYIGQVRSTRPNGVKRGTRERFYEHVRSARKNEHKCVRLERAIREHGVENFDVDILCYAYLHELDDIEKDYISKYNSTEIEFGYNMTHGGKNNITEITRQVLSIKVKQQWKDPKFREKISNSVRESSIKRWKNPELRERMMKGISDSLRKRFGNDKLPEYVYFLKIKGTLAGYRASINRFKKQKIFASKKFSMEEKLEMVISQVDEWKKELNLN